MLHIVLNAIYHFPLGEVSNRGIGGTEEVQEREEGGGERGEEKNTIRVCVDSVLILLTRLLVFLNFLHFGMRSFACST